MFDFEMCLSFHMDQTCPSPDFSVFMSVKSIRLYKYHKSISIKIPAH
jgi:hypothetical protein